MIKKISTLVAAWNKFWFEPLAMAPLGLMRWLLGSTLLILYFQRQWAVEMFFGNQGIIPENIALEMVPQFNRPPWLLLAGLEHWIFSVHLLFLIGLFFVTIGVGGRVLALIVWLLQVGFIQRNYAVAFGADLIGGIFLFYLAMANSGQCLKLSSILKEGLRVSLEKAWLQKTDLLGSTFYRLMQVQLCVIYVYTGLEKLKGASWWDGTALWTVFANPQMTILDLTWTRWIYPFLVAMTFATMLFEIYFPVFVWMEKWRRPALIAGLFFHLGIGLSMGLFSFAAVMISSYCLFLRSTDLKARSKSVSF